MLHKNTLQIPEIADVVASFLQPQDLATCVCVSRSWREVFLPLQWQAIELGCKADHKDTLPNPGLFGPPPDVVSSYRHLIHNLTLVKEVTPFIQHQYPNVHTLTIDYTGAAHFRLVYFHVSLDLKGTFPSLVELALTKATLVPGLWKALADYSRIKSLRLEDIRIDPDSIQAFWKVVESLEVLEMKKTPFPNLDRKLRTDIKFYQLRKLLLDLFSMANLPRIYLIARCPSLEDLEWTEDLGSRFSFGHALQHACWPHLERMSTSFPFRDDELALMLARIGDGRGKLAQLKLVRCRLGTNASAALGLHFNTLVEVNITDNQTVLSTTPRDLLCHCPRLEVLEARNLMAKDIVAGGPWVCQRLRKLTACFWFEESEKGLQQEIFERLSKLTRLEELSIHVLKKGAMNGYVLKFRLEYGMGQLASLRELTTFHFVSDIDGCYADLGMAEIEWIKDHWKKLKRVKGSLNSCNTTHYNLKVAFEEHGIAVIDQIPNTITNNKTRNE